MNLVRPNRVYNAFSYKGGPDQADTVVVQQVPTVPTLASLEPKRLDQKDAEESSIQCQKLACRPIDHPSASGS